MVDGEAVSLPGGAALLGGVDELAPDASGFGAGDEPGVEQSVEGAAHVADRRGGLGMNGGMTCLVESESPRRWRDLRGDWPSG